MDDLSPEQKKAVKIYLEACQKDDDAVIDSFRDAKNSARIASLQDSLTEFHNERLDTLISMVAEKNQKAIDELFANRTKSGKDDYANDLVKALMANGGIKVPSSR